MIQFQKTFTNAEQSKRLLELGVPADSADCYMSLTGYIGIWQDDDEDKIYCVDYIPCWSVGRLMDIELICREQIEGMIPRLIVTREFTLPPTSGREMLDNIIYFMEKGGFKYDFSKLED